MERVYISIGSNVGDRVENCRTAIEELNGAKGVSVVRVSSFYETEPWGRADQGPFVNCVVEISAVGSPDMLLVLLKEIERRMGRGGRETGRADSKNEHWGPRVIDLDIVLYGDCTVRKEGLVIPHPLAAGRAFVLVPLNEIAPDVTYPLLNKKVSELAEDVPGKEGVRRIEK